MVFQFTKITILTFCGIRKCAKGKGIEICIECGEYPCNRFSLLAKGYPTLLSDGKRLKEIGIDKWIEEQEKEIDELWTKEVESRIDA